MAEMCYAIGIQVNKSQKLSSRVCSPCGRKIRTANEYITFIRSRIANDSTTRENTSTSSPARFKRVLPTTALHFA